MTPGTIIAAGYPLIDSERQSLAKRIDAEIAPLVEALEEVVRKFDAAPDPVKNVPLGIMRARAAIAKAKQEERT